MRTLRKAQLSIRCSGRPRARKAQVEILRRKPGDNRAIPSPDDRGYEQPDDHRRSRIYGNEHRRSLATVDRPGAHRGQTDWPSARYNAPRSPAERGRRRRMEGFAMAKARAKLLVDQHWRVSAMIDADDKAPAALMLSKTRSPGGHAIRHESVREPGNGDLRKRGADFEVRLAGCKARIPKSATGPNSK
jgi:hypothetical protein